MAKEPKSKQVVKFRLSFQLDAPKGLASMAALDKKVSEAQVAFAAALGIDGAAIERIDTPARVNI